MRDLKNKLTSSKNSKNIQKRKGKSFGYQVLGFGAGGVAPIIASIDNLLVVAGGGGGQVNFGGGGGAGGLRTFSCISDFEVEPGVSIPVSIGAGGSPSGNGVDSSIVMNCTTYTSTGGGTGYAVGGSGGGAEGGSGGPGIGAAGNTPPTTPSQGNPGGNRGPGSPSASTASGAGGGGSSSAGNGSSSGSGGPGGAGSDLSPTFGTSSGVCGVFAGGGGGGNNPGGGGSGGSGGGASQRNNAIANTGGGGGGGSQTGNPTNLGGTGGPGTVLLKIPAAFGSAITLSPGCNTIICGPATSKIAKFVASGSMDIT